MKNNLLKFTVGFLALAIGIMVVWTSGIYQVLLPANNNLSSTETVPTQQSVREKSGKVLLSFKNFEYGKEWIANFEITNDTTQSIFYVGSKRKDRLDYCTLAVKHEEPFPANPDGKIDNLTFKTTDLLQK